MQHSRVTPVNQAPWAPRPANFITSARAHSLTQSLIHSPAHGFICIVVPRALPCRAPCYLDGAKQRPAPLIRCARQRGRRVGEGVGVWTNEAGCDVPPRTVHPLQDCPRGTDPSKRRRRRRQRGRSDNGRTEETSKSLKSAGLIQRRHTAQVPFQNTQTFLAHA